MNIIVHLYQIYVPPRGILSPLFSLSLPLGCLCLSPSFGFPDVPRSCKARAKIPHSMTSTKTQTTQKIEAHRRHHLKMIYEGMSTCIERMQQSESEGQRLCSKTSGNPSLKPKALSIHPIMRGIIFYLLGKRRSSRGDLTANKIHIIIYSTTAIIAFLGYTLLFWSHLFVLACRRIAYSSETGANCDNQKVTSPI